MSTNIRIGTSGYTYFWNEGKPTPFQWYIQQGFNTVEINASFYRFPTDGWLKGWSKAPEDFTFTMKVHRSITHFAKLRGKAFSLWERFRSRLQPMEGRIEFWLFQMPPNYHFKNSNLESLREFHIKSSLGSKAVFEFREKSWWEHADEFRQVDAAFCSVDAPGLPRKITAVNDVIYLRLHGRDSWYAYTYSEGELDEILAEVKRISADRKYILLNNDHGMLPNGRYLLRAIGQI